LSRWAADLELSQAMYDEAGLLVRSVPEEAIHAESAEVTVAPGGFFKRVLSRLLGG
jgi:dCMP deaminase